MRFSILSLLAVGTMAIAVTQLYAQDAGDRRRGELFARQVCAECHAVGTRDLRSPNGYAPSFVSIASTPGMTEAALNYILHNYHRRMPNLILTDDQAREVIAYIISLKK
jgi:mono/diheme cytochrome c family protein